MRSTRIYLDRDLAPGLELCLSRAAFHHAINVLRHPVGVVLSLFNGDGREYQAQLIAIARKEAAVRVLSSSEPAVESPLRTTLVQAVIKGDRMDYALQKAVELGVSQIRPLFTEHAGACPGQGRLQKKIQHWTRVIVSACEQSGRTRIPPLLTPLDSAEAIAALEGPGVLLAPSARSPLGSVPTGRDITVFIGPEGGFSATELALAADRGIAVATLGPRILRAETAAVAALTILQSLWGDLGPVPMTDRGAPPWHDMQPAP